jgi:hypothetical protein
MMPAELQKLHRHVLDAEVIEVISDDMREVVEDEWPELTYKLPPRAAARTSAAITPGRPPEPQPGRAKRKAHYS